MNQNLPELSIWQARSTYYVLITVVFSVLNALGISVPEDFDADGIADLFIALVPVVSGFMAWYERRSPNYQLKVRTKNPHIA